MLANVVAGIIWIGISAYAVFGGADFGAGIWDLFAGDEEKGREPRQRIERSIGPVWEANHVWLIFILVYLWTAFPEPFVSIATTLWIPLTAAAFGIIFRGSGFAFRKWADTTSRRRFYGAFFAGASVITPFFLGVVVGAVASGRVPLGNAEGDVWASWITPTSMLGGVMAVLACAFVAAVLLTYDSYIAGTADLVVYFRRRAIATGLVSGVVALIGIPILAVDAPALFRALLALQGEVFLVASALGGLGSVWALWTHRYNLARPLSVVAVIAVLWGWGAGQYPWVLHQVALAEDYAAGDPTLWGLILAFVAAAVLAIPALLALYGLTQRGALDLEGGSRDDSSQALLDRLQAREDEEGEDRGS